MGYVATMDSPNQGARGLQVDSVTVKGIEICFTMSALRAVYRGEFKHIKTVVNQSSTADRKTLRRIEPPFSAL